MRKIGGKDIIVEIDESKFAKRKYNVGHPVQGGSVFGGREKDNKRKVFMKAVPDRTENTLLTIIQKWVAPGSITWSDCWKSYYSIPDLPEGYKHATFKTAKTFRIRNLEHALTEFSLTGDMQRLNFPALEPDLKCILAVSQCLGRLIQAADKGQSQNSPLSYN